MSILNGTRRGAKRSVGAAALVMFAGLAAAAVAPQAIPPQKQTELDRQETERAARAEYEGLVRRAELRDATAVREARPAREAHGVAVVREPRSPHAPRAPRGVSVVAGSGGMVSGEAPISVSVEPTPPTPPGAPESATIVTGKLGRIHSGALRRWSELSEDKAALREKLSAYKLLENPELAGVYQKLGIISAELDGKAAELDGIAGKLTPLHGELDQKRVSIEQRVVQLRQLQDLMRSQMHTIKSQEMDRVQQTLAARAQIHQGTAEEWKQKEMELRRQMAAVGERIQDAAERGDTQALRDLERQITDLVNQRDEVAAIAFGVRQSQPPTIMVGEGGVVSDRNRAAVEELQLQMEDVQHEIERAQESMGHQHEGMEGVHQEMEGVHAEMEAVAQKRESVHERIEQIIREEIGKIIKESLAEQGLSPDNPKAARVIEAVKAAMGNRMMMFGVDATEMVHITDPTEHFLKMREAIARAEAAGDLRLSDEVERKLETALKRAADRSEVLRFRVGPHGDGGQK